MNANLSRNIIATVAYYDGLEYPITAFEIWKHMIIADYCNLKKEAIPPALSDVFQNLYENGLSDFLENKNGFYFLKGRDNIVEKRIQNGKISLEKLNKVILIAKWLKFVPFVRMIGITGAIAMKNAREKSDLDLLMVMKGGKIWIGRTFATILVHLLKKRRHGRKISDRVCLNYFITDKSLEIMTKDLFSASEYMFILPIFGKKTFEKFQIKNNWIKTMKLSYGICEIFPIKAVKESALSRYIKRILEIIFSLEIIENWLKKAEKKLIMRNPKTYKEGGLIYAQDDALIFLPEPHGPVIFEKFKSKIENLGI